MPALQLPFQITGKSLEEGEDILSKQDLSFSCHSPKYVNTWSAECVNTWSGQQRGISPGYGYRETKAAMLLNRISYLFVWHLIALNKGQCVLTVLPFVPGKRADVALVLSSKISHSLILQSGILNYFSGAHSIKRHFLPRIQKEFMFKTLIHHDNKGKD